MRPLWTLLSMLNGMAPDLGLLKKGRFVGIEDPQRFAVEAFRAALVGQLGFADAELGVDLRALAADAVSGAGGWE